jgi:hypothetical protein
VKKGKDMDLVRSYLPIINLGLRHHELFDIRFVEQEWLFRIVVG